MKQLVMIHTEFDTTNDSYEKICDAIAMFEGRTFTAVGYQGSDDDPYGDIRFIAMSDEPYTQQEIDSDIEAFIKNLKDEDEDE
jgi:hypothetical protein